jgi:hypothetical protein
MPLNFDMDAIFAPSEKPQFLRGKNSEYILLRDEFILNFIAPYERKMIGDAPKNLLQKFALVENFAIHIRC